ncbi:hypothetical protein SGLAM104S_02687 [Streptomyces glaucescens]
MLPPPTQRKGRSVKRRTLLRGTTALGAAALAAGAAPHTAAAAPSPRGDGAPFRVHVVLFDGVEELDLSAPYEVLAASDYFTDRSVDVRYVALDGPRTVRAAFGTTLRLDHAWAPEQADLLVVPGGGYARRDDPGVWAEIRRVALPRALAGRRVRIGSRFVGIAHSITDVVAFTQQVGLRGWDETDATAVDTSHGDLLPMPGRTGSLSGQSCDLGTEIIRAAPRAM